MVANAEEPQQNLIVPSVIESVILDFDRRQDAFSCMDVQSALGVARQTLKEPSPAENTGAWAEVLAFALVGSEHHDSPWNTHYGPMASDTTADGKPFYSPDVRQAAPSILEHWRARARAATSPVLQARYADLVWDLGNLIAKAKPEIEFGRLAFEAGLTAAKQDGRELYDAFVYASRALGIAIQIRDDASRDRAREVLLDLHRRAMSTNSMWWEAFDILEEQPKAGLTDSERNAFIADLEAVLARVSDVCNAQTFDPHAVESVVERLVKLYRRSGREAAIPLLYAAVGRAFERFGEMGDALLAATVYQTSMDAYRVAGLPADADRMLRLIEQSNLASHAQMQRHEHRIEIPKEKVEEFLQQVIQGSLEESFERIAVNFLMKRKAMEQGVQEMALEAPLSAMIAQTRIQGDRVVAQIGSTEDDPIGRLIDHTNYHLNFSTVWLGWAFDRLQSTYKPSPDDIAAWANRTGLFGDGRLLADGLAAWAAEDHMKALHVLVPQIEAAFRMLVGRLGRPTTKAHPQMRQARMVVTMGEVLFHEETPVALGKNGADLVLHFRTLYADPRGHNLRNDIAHGILPYEAFGAGNALWVIHSLLLLGAWLKPIDTSNDSARSTS